MPLLRMAMYAQGIELYCVPTVDDRETCLPTMRTIALEGRCFVLSACQYLTRADCPAAYASNLGDDPQTVLIRGGSCIVDPLGNILIEPNFEGEAIRVGELDQRASHVGCGTLSRIPRLSRTISAGCLCSDLVRSVRTFFQPVRCDWGDLPSAASTSELIPTPARLTIPSKGR
jgi:hypothetical protein